MASSSVSQESLDHEDFEVSTRRTRVRVMRCRVAPAERNKPELADLADDGKELADGDRTAAGPYRLSGSSGPAVPGMMMPGGHVSFSAAGSVLAACEQHESSPNRLKIKDKRGWPGYLHKTKPVAKDKRKLREKRRSTGLVHMQSTESTGDSLDENDKDQDAHRANTYNEVIDADNPQTPEEDRKSFVSRKVRNKSPSDLDADLEDNQDYDSTVSQSETSSKLSVTLQPTAVTASSATKQGDGVVSSVPSPGGTDPASPTAALSDVVNSTTSCTTVEKLLADEMEKNRRLHEMLTNKDRVIANLEQRIADLTKAAPP